MSDLAIPAPSQPAPPAQTSDAQSDNRSGADFKRQLLTSFIERQAAADAPTQPPAVETAQPETPAQVTETPTANPEQPAPEQPVTTPEPTPEPVPTAEPAEADEGDEADATDVLSQLSSLDPRTQKIVRDFMDKWVQRRHEKIQKKIDKERAMRGDLARELAELKAKPQVTPEVQRVAIPSEASPLADINDIQSLTRRHAEAVEAKDWARVTLDNEQWERVNSNGRDVEVVREGDRYFTKADVKTILRNAEKALEAHIPQRLTFLQRREQVHNAARQDFPFLSDKNSPEYQQVQAAYQARPWLMNDPEAELIISAAVEGLKVAQQRRAAAQATPTSTTKPAAQKPPASQTAVPATAAASRVNGEQETRRKAAQEREKLGVQGNVTSADLKRYFKSSYNR